MTASESKGIKVAIVGGGVCGLTCAVALLRRGIHVEVFEAAAQFGEIGAGVGIGPNATRLLEHLGVLEEVLKETLEPGLTMGPFLFLSGMEGHEMLYEYPERDHGLGAHRPSFLNAMVKFVDPSITHFNKRCTSVAPSASNPGRTMIHFADGTTHEADVVIGADGIKSSVRPYVAGDDASRVIFSNTICYRGLIPMATVRAAGVTLDFSQSRTSILLGVDRHIVVFPVRGGNLVNVVAFHADHNAPLGSPQLPRDEWVKPVSQQELLDVYAGWGPEVTGLLNCIKTPSKWSIHMVYPPLESYVKGNVALIGDAAHGMLPHMGAGAGQGMEDGYILAQLLAHPQTSNTSLESVLRAYDRVRRPRAQMVWNGSYNTGKIYDGKGEHGLNADGVKQDIGTRWDDVWHHEVDDDVTLAVAWLKEISAC
ncbi:FAD/NAD(P)-binding domain-containing protein [Wolfiporia cocos MD-104 SS10]|uniref:FAD/NAD(P)-binding domain-containing protein n=1 Tax=Wolfiporia cocos (strain MD-104) TaxID=742152 RepID=A0A2H3J2N8_WOLCO|nr:FAD/NAD(P)-binding domain-containing protein [Wolfiporia cocos MD-104 SS10]